MSSSVILLFAVFLMLPLVSLLVLDGLTHAFDYPHDDIFDPIQID